MDYRPLELEKQIREFWNKNQTQKQLIEFREKNNIGILGYVEGPPTLNGIPHVGHARGRVMKDLRYRWKTMQGYFILSGLDGTVKACQLSWKLKSS